ncbi:MAG: LuxR C-terminal-related transcriptional regulator [Caldilineaceae bacterium]
MHEPLSEREIEILQLAADGYANGEIAARLSLALNTVKWYSKRIYEKLAVENRAQAIKRAQALGLLDANPQPAKPAQPYVKLPNPLTPLVGRRAEVDAVKQLLKQHRLLTLTGPGGIGKTRLALQAAEEMRGFFPDGVCFVDLSAIHEAGLVTNTIAHVLDVAESLETPLATLIQAALRDKQFLLVLDNFEHLLDAAPLVAELLMACRMVTVLITSREILALYGEQEYAVPPLQLPDLEWFAAGHLAPSKLFTSEALQLFERSAQAATSDFRLTAENAPAIASICLRLDGLPLAIELAAAYVKLLSPQEILTQLDSQWLAMKRVLRNVPARQQTLRNTIEWSYRFLNAAERQLFAELAIFRGGCTWEALTAVCTSASPVALLEPLNGLVNKSLVWRRVTPNGQPRFGMLEIIREYALSCLQTQGAVETLQQRHALFYTEYTNRVEAELLSIKQRQVLNQLEGEVDNFRAALRWALDHDPTPGLRMIGDLGSCWRIRGYLTEGMAWAQQLLAVRQPAPTLVQARAYASTASLALVLGQRGQACQLAEQACQLAEQVTDPQTQAQALHTLANTRLAPNLPAAEYADLIQMINEAARLYAASAHRLGQGRVLNLMGEVLRMQQLYVEAKQYYEASLQALRATGYVSGVTMALINLGWVAFHLGDYKAAFATFVESLDLSCEIDYPHNIAMSLIGGAGALARLQQPAPAVKLLAAADAIRQAIGVAMDLSDEPDYEQTRAELQTRLGPAAFDHGWQVGSTLTVAEAAALMHTFC